MTEPDIDDNVKQSIWALVQYLTARKWKRSVSSARSLLPPMFSSDASRVLRQDDDATHNPLARKEDASCST